MENLIATGEELEEDDSDDEDYLTAYVVPPEYARRSPLPRALGSPSVKVTIVLGRGLSEEFLACVDTGSQRTVITTAYLLRVFGPAYENQMEHPKKMPQLISASGHPLKVIGTLNAVLKIGKFRTEHQIVVYNDAVPQMLIGLDVIADNLTIEQGRRITFADKKLPPVDIISLPLRAKATLLGETVLGPHAVMLVAVQLAGGQMMGGRDVLLTADRASLQECPFRVLNTLTVTSPKGAGNLKLFNPTNQIVYLPEGQILAEGRIINDGHGYKESTERPDLNSKWVKAFREAHEVPDYLKWHEDIEMVEAPVGPPEHVQILHDREQRQEILEDTKGRMPEPKGMGVEDLAPPTEAGKSWEEQAELGHLPPHRRDKVRAMLKRCAEAFAKTKDELGTFNYWEVSLPEVEGAKPCADKFRPLNPRKAEAAKATIDQLLKLGCIRPSSSNYAANLVVVTRELPNGERKDRTCYDARTVNKQLVHQVWPNASTWNCFQKVGNADMKTFLDLKSAFHQMVITPSDRHKTAFYGPGVNSPALYEWCRLPFGLQVSMAAFLTAIAVITCGLSFIQAFADDIAVATEGVGDDGEPLSEEETFDKHVRECEIILRRLAHSGLKLNVKKCNWFMDRTMSVDWLGNTLNGYLMSPMKAKCQTIRAYPTPRTNKEALSFVSLCSYYRQYVMAFGVLARPLYDAYKSDPFVWSEKADRAFNLLKDRLCSEPILRAINPRLPFILYADASGQCAGVILHQVHDGQEWAVAYGSRQFSDREQRLLSIPGKELMSILYGLTLWSDLISGSVVEVRTDCKAWCYLSLTTGSSNKMARLGMMLTEFNLSITHIPGRKNVASDAISRAYIDMSKPTIEVSELERHPLVDQLKAPIPERDKMPLAEYLAQCQDHLATHWPEVLAEGTIAPNELALVQFVCEAFVVDRFRAGRQPSELPRRKPTVSHIVTRDPELMIKVGSVAEFREDQNIAGRVCLVAINETAFTPEAFAAAQACDHRLLSIRQALMRLPMGQQRQDFFLRKGIVLKKSDPNPVVCIPRELVPMMVNTYHTTLMGGHLGPRKMLADLKQKYYWPSMKRDIRKAYRECVPCSYNKKFPVKYPQGKVMTSPKFPNHVVYLDLMPGMLKAYDGSIAVLLCYDGFSRFGMAIPLKSQKAEYVAKKFMQHYVQSYGFPMHLMSDNATNLSSSMMNWICRILNIKKTESPSWSPRSEQCENLVQAVAQLLKVHMGQRDRKMWPVVLPFLMAAYNGAVNTSSLYSPAEIFLGRTYAVNLGHPVVDPTEEGITKNEYLATVRRAQEYQFEFIRKRDAARQEARMKVINRNANEPRFEEGGYCLVKRFVNTKGPGHGKFESKWDGPFRILRRLPKCVILIRYGDGRKLDRFHQDPELFRTKQLGDPNSKPFFFEVISIQHIKPYHGPINAVPEYDEMLVERFMGDLKLQGQPDLVRTPAENNSTDSWPQLTGSGEDPRGWDDQSDMAAASPELPPMDMESLELGGGPTSMAVQPRSSSSSSHSSDDDPPPADLRRARPRQALPRPRVPQPMALPSTTRPRLSSTHQPATALTAIRPPPVQPPPPSSRAADTCGREPPQSGAAAATSPSQPLSGEKRVGRRELGDLGPALPQGRKRNPTGPPLSNRPADELYGEEEGGDLSWTPRRQAAANWSPFRPRGAGRGRGTQSPRWEIPPPQSWPAGTRPTGLSPRSPAVHAALSPQLPPRRGQRPQGPEDENLPPPRPPRPPEARRCTPRLSPARAQPPNSPRAAQDRRIQQLEYETTKAKERLRDATGSQYNERVDDVAKAEDKLQAMRRQCEEDEMEKEKEEGSPRPPAASVAAAAPPASHHEPEPEGENESFVSCNEEGEEGAKDWSSDGDLSASNETLQPDPDDRGSGRLGQFLVFGEKGKSDDNDDDRAGGGRKRKRRNDGWTSTWWC